MSSITLYHCVAARSFRPLWMLEELGLPFTLKMLLLFAAGCNAAAFHARRSLERLDATARALMLLSTVIWLAVITCGRWIAYL